jgi:hypothetical protein
MGYENVSVDFNRLLSDLAKLQSRWERRLTDAEQHGRGKWALGVLFGIETGRARIAGDNPRSLAELNALLNEWEGIRARAEASLVKETSRGLDFGIRLVIGRVRRFLNSDREDNPARPKPPTSANSGKARSGNKRRPGARP